ncbi:alkaline phosphatase [Halobacillus sp. Marseille-P3879]|uniref:alkaline phosphatase n=1 Tax=Halobacillus sp. Marseille-P3879 TaxID=2045014 RepID=UPI000C7DBE23|nr:alkaline phosphatase [Halobacillus sp. Marseille-P3879]
MLKKSAALLVSSTILFSGASLGDKGSVYAEESNSGNENVKNVIYMIPDGYSAGYATNYRWFKGEDSSFDPYLKGMMKTYSEDTEVTDSAAAGTAMATGSKTNNGMVGVTPDGEKLDSILNASENAGKSSGLVATSTITHATPAVFASHVEDRDNEAGIAPQLLENDVDILLGGGKEMFLPESEGGQQAENLIQQAEEDGYAFAETKDELMDLKKKDRILGLFADEALSPELERSETEEPSLSDMTSTAIDSLSQDEDGFFLMVEGSQIDWAGHAHDAAWAMNDTAAFEKAVEEAIEYAKEDKETLVVIAGDHETGGMTVGSNGEYDVKQDVIQGVSATGDHMAEQLNKDRSNVAQVVEEYTSVELSEEEIETIRSSEKPNEAINNAVSDHALVGWTSSVHTGVDVPIYAYGPASNDFSGLVNNTDIPKKMASAMGVELGNHSENNEKDNKDKQMTWKNKNNKNYATPANGWNEWSVVDYLKSKGYPAGFSFRGKVAASYNVKNYKGTAPQNITMLEQLKEELN